MRSITAFFSTLVCALALLVIWPCPDAEAIPAFARKYETSCQTCHIAYPKLNPFGEAFRLRGYHLPDETEDLIKEVPVSLGAPSYKKVWPQTVWPSDMAGTVPVSLGMTLTSYTQRVSEEDEKETIKNDFRFPEEFEIFSGGTLGESLSFFGEIAFEPETEEGHSGVEIELEHAQLNINGPFGSGQAFNVKVGRFTPELSQPFSHSSVLTTGGPAAFLQYIPIAAHGGSEVGGHHGGAGIELPHSVDGVEVYGILGHRFLYSGGFSNGVGPGDESVDGNTAKDVFGRVAYKIGGLAFDGDGYVESDKNWREVSLRLGFFGYRGDAEDVFFQGTGHHAGNLLEDPRFNRFGFDANLFVQDLNLMAGFVRGEDTIVEYRSTGPRESDFIFKAWYLQGDYVILPWLHGSTRYEWLDPGNQNAPDFKRIVPHVTALIRANVKTYLEYQRNLDDNDDYVLLGGLRVLF